MSSKFASRRRKSRTMTWIVSVSKNEIFTLNRRRPTAFSLFMLLICRMDFCFVLEWWSKANESQVKWQHCDFLTGAKNLRGCGSRSRFYSMPPTNPSRFIWRRKLNMKKLLFCRFAQATTTTTTTPCGDVEIINRYWNIMPNIETLLICDAPTHTRSLVQLSIKKKPFRWSQLEAFVTLHNQRATTWIQFRFMSSPRLR